MKHFLTAICLLLVVHAAAPAADMEFRRDKSDNTHLLIFVHGFTGHYTETWAQFPDLILADKNLANYDILMWGYPSKILSRNPEIDRIGRHLKTELDYLPERYQHIVIAAHSMGGLVVRASVVAALMDGRRDDLTKIEHIVLYGTPNEGVDKAYAPKFINKQVADMRTASAFIIDVRNQWLDRVYRADDFNDNYHLEIPTTTVVGLEDRFVPEVSVSSFFRDYAMTDGDHSSMVKPSSDNHLSFKILRKKMMESETRRASNLNEQDAEIPGYIDGLVLTTHTFDSSDGYRLLGKVVDNSSPPFSYGAHQSIAPKWNNYDIKQHTWNGFIEFKEAGEYEFSASVKKNFPDMLDHTNSARVKCSYALDIDNANILQHRFTVVDSRKNDKKNYFTVVDPGIYEFSYKLGCDTRGKSYRDRFKAVYSNLISEIFMMEPSNTEYRPISKSDISHSIEQE